MTTPAFPPGRYGRRRERRPARRGLAVLLGALALLLTFGLATVAYRNQNAAIQASVTGFTIGPREVRITFDVSRPADQALLCLLRARDEAGAEVGRAELQVPAGSRTVTLTYTLRTRHRAVTGEVYGCAPRSG